MGANLAAPMVVSAVGTAAALLSITSFAPQIVKIWREKDASSVSLRTYVVTVTGFSCVAEPTKLTSKTYSPAFTRSIVNLPCASEIAPFELPLIPTETCSAG